MVAGHDEYLLAPGDGPSATGRRLASLLTVGQDVATTTVRTYYDTFDRRLRVAGRELVHEASRLTVHDDGAFAACAEPPERLFAADLPDGALRELLASVADVRALTPVARVHSDVRRLRVLDGEGKTVVRVVIETPRLADGARAPLAPRLRLAGVRGYAKALARARRAVEDELGLAPATVSLCDEAVVKAGGSVHEPPPRPDAGLRPDDPAPRAVAAVLARLHATIEDNLPGVVADVDTEFLHDLRVAVRRTRSVQRQLSDLFPPEPLERFRADFRWLQQVTGPTRDLDVNLLDFDGLAGMLAPTARPDLEPLRALLAARRADEHRRMVRALRSRRAQNLLVAWPELVERLARGEGEARAIAAVVGARVAAVYRRMVRAGRAIDAETPPEALHELRKTGKELRYLLELFAGVFPSELVAPMVRSLKALQDVLGRFQDREVQADRLRALGADVAALEGGSAALMTMGVLVERLAGEQAAARAEFAGRFRAFASAEQRARVAEAFR